MILGFPIFLETPILVCNSQSDDIPYGGTCYYHIYHIMMYVERGHITVIFNFTMNFQMIKNDI